MAVYNKVVSSFQLLVICLFLQKISGQCFPTSCTSSCTEECYPNIWERDLCIFYRQISLWRVSAERCGLSLPDSPDRSAQLPAQVKWAQAKQYWEELVLAWQRAALTNGILNQQQVGTMLGDSDSWSTPSESTSTMGLGSGDISSGDSFITPTIQSVTSEPPTSPVHMTQLSEWLDSTQTWESHFTRWESFVKSQSGLQLPDSSVTDIIDRLDNTTQASAVRENSRKWISLVNIWGQTYDTYVDMFSGVCPNL